MSAINSLGNGSAGLLWALYQNMSSRAEATSSTATTDSASGSSSLSGDATQSTDATNDSNGLTGLGGQLNANMLLTLIEAQGQSTGANDNGQGLQGGFAQGAPPDPSQMADKLMSSLDQNGSGSISQSDIEQAFTANGGTTSQADALFSSLDTNHDGTVSKDELTSALSSLKPPQPPSIGSFGAGSGATADPLNGLFSDLQANSQTSQSTTNADGSTSTTLTFSDGETLTLTTPTSNTSTSTGSSTATTTDAQSQTDARNLLAMLAKIESSLLQSTQPTQLAA